MDHLPLPRNPKLQREEIPYVCKQEYDGKGFLTYAERTGWTKDDIIIEDAYQRTKEDVSSFIQAYLWFGLGHEVFGDAFNTRSMTRLNDRQETVLTTEALPDIAESWIKKQQKEPSCRSRSLSRYRHLRLCLLRVDQTLKIPELKDDRKLDFKVFTSIYFLVEYLSLVISKCFPVEAAEEPLLNCWGCRWSSTIKYELDQLEKAKSKWCPSETERFQGGLKSLATLHFCFNLDPPGAAKNHERCTSELCVAYQIKKNETYKTKHAMVGCRCLKTSVESSQIDPILEGGHIPLLHIVETGDPRRVKISVVSSDAEKDYVAISHIWADGMGDPLNNALPSCQLRKLKKLIGRLPQTVVKEQSSALLMPTIAHIFNSKTMAVALKRLTLHLGNSLVSSSSHVKRIFDSLQLNSESSRTSSDLAVPAEEVDQNMGSAGPSSLVIDDKPLALWIDTICCPVKPGPMKNLAIMALKKTYEQAKHVLVIDSYLESVAAADLSKLEILIRIFMCGWTRRIWTLQEGVLAKRLWFQFADGPVEFNEVFSSWLLGGRAFRDEPVVEDIKEMFTHISEFRRENKMLSRPDMPVPLKLRLALRHRSTSESADEAICLANLLDLPESNTAEILETPGDERMEIIWKNIPVRPAGVIFSNIPRLKNKGYRWAPSTFLGRQLKQWCDQSTKATWEDCPLQPEGLQVSFPGFLFSSIVPCLRRFWFKDTQGVWYETFLDLSLPEVSTEFEPSACNRTAIILPRWPSPPKEQVDDLIIHQHGQWTPAILTVVTAFDGAIYVRTQRTFFVQILQDADAWVGAANACGARIAQAEAEMSEQQPAQDFNREELRMIFVREALAVLHEQKINDTFSVVGRLKEEVRHDMVEWFREMVNAWFLEGSGSIGPEAEKTNDRQSWVVD